MCTYTELCRENKNLFINIIIKGKLIQRQRQSLVEGWQSSIVYILSSISQLGSRWKPKGKTDCF